MKKLRLFIVLLSSATSLNGMDVHPVVSLETIEGLDDKAAQAIFASLDKLSDVFGDSERASEIKNRLAQLKDKTKAFPILSEVVSDIEKAIAAKNSREFWKQEAYLRALLRPTIIAARPQFKKGYLESFVARMRNAANSFYQWLFPKTSGIDGNE